MRRFIIIVILFFFGCKNTSTGKYRQNKLVRHIDEIYKNHPVFKHHSSAFLVYDIENEDFIYKHNEDKYFVPASNTKILTCLASIKLLGEKLIFGRVYKEYAGECTLKPYGDPSFLNPKFEQSQSLNWFKKNCYKVNIMGYPYMKPYGPGWAWDDMNDEYCTERSYLPVYGGLIKAIVYQDSGTKKPSKQVLYPSIFKDSLLFSSQYEKPIKCKKSNVICWKKLYNHKNDTTSIPLSYNTKVINNIFSEEVKVPTTNVRKKYLDNNKSIDLETIEVDSVLKEMMINSDNFIAEQLLIQIGLRFWGITNLNDIIKKIVEENVITLDPHSQWVDGSGLSRYNMLSPIDIILNLKRLLMAKKITWIENIFAVGGESGTIKDWYIGKSNPYVFAKTGTLKNVHNISGYLKTKSGKTLIFCFMNNQMTVSYDDLRNQIQNIFTYFNEYY